MITRYAPDARWRTFGSLGKLIDEVFCDSPEFRSGWLPAADIKETDTELTFIVELPGLKQEEIEVEMIGKVLTIRGKREFGAEEKKDDYVRIERCYGSFQRSFTIGVPVKSDSISADFKDGVLTVHVPKAEEIKPHRIMISKN